MIKIEKTKVVGWEATIRGMRNPMNSWDKSDSCNSVWGDSVTNMCFRVGENDKDLMHNLAGKGPVHAKYRRMIVVYVDVTAPLYWWKEYDTYKVGTVANSCSTMHKIHAKEFTLDDFSHEHLRDGVFIMDNHIHTDIPPKFPTQEFSASAQSLLMVICDMLNNYRELYLQTKDKRYWWQMIQLLPSSYNQKRTLMLNYEVLANIYSSRKNHKLDEWREFCEWIKSLPHSELITLEGSGDNGLKAKITCVDEFTTRGE